MEKGLRKIINLLVLLLWVLLFLRVFMICLSYRDDIPGVMYYMFRQLVYTVSWMSLLVFFQNYIGAGVILYEIYIEKMKTISFWTMVVSAIRLVVSLVYFWPVVSYKVWPSLYNVLEILVWLCITVFFFLYWREKSNAVKK